MNYYQLGFIGLMMLCFGIPAFFISSTGINGGNFKMNEVSAGILGMCIAGAIICIGSYSTSNRLIKKQSQTGINHE